MSFIERFDPELRSIVSNSWKSFLKSRANKIAIGVIAISGVFDGARALDHLQSVELEEFASGTLYSGSEVLMFMRLTKARDNAFLEEQSIMLDSGQEFVIGSEPQVLGIPSLLEPVANL